MDAIFILTLVLGGFVSGYAFRGYIGKEITKIGAEIRSIIADAKAKL